MAIHTLFSYGRLPENEKGAASSSCSRTPPGPPLSCPSGSSSTALCCSVQKRQAKCEMCWMPTPSSASIPGVRSRRSEWLEARIGVVHTVVPGWVCGAHAPNTHSCSQEHKPFRTPLALSAKMPQGGRKAWNMGGRPTGQREEMQMSFRRSR